MAPRSALGELEGVADAALDAVAGVDRSLRRDLERRAPPERAPFAGVGALGVLADDDEIGALGDRARDSVERAQVDVQIELETQPQQQAPLHHPRRHRRGPDRRTDGTEQDGVGGPRAPRGPSRAAPHRCAGSGRRRGRSRPCRAPRRRRRRPSAPPRSPPGRSRRRRSLQPCAHLLLCHGPACPTAADGVRCPARKSKGRPQSGRPTTHTRSGSAPNSKLRSVVRRAS